jgi:hypothetical protein
MPPSNESEDVYDTSLFTMQTILHDSNVITVILGTTKIDAL